MVPAASAQTRRTTGTSNKAATAGQQHSNFDRANNNANVSAVGTNTTQQGNMARTTDPVQNGGIIVPDHAYQPAGTEGVGFFGNGTGGSTIGSTPESGGTGLGNTMPASDTKPKSKNAPR